MTDSVSAILAVRNRRDLTVACIGELLSQAGPGLVVNVVVVDDGSSDGTAKAIIATYPTVKVVPGDGSLFWGGGMRLAEREARLLGSDYVLWVNDDAVLEHDAIARLIDTAQGKAIACGAFSDARTGSTTYSGVRRSRGLGFTLRRVEPQADRPTPVDSFNGNLVLVPAAIAQSLSGIDPTFTHHWGDFDYGLRATRAGYDVLLAPGHVGTTSRNAPAGRYRDRGLPRRKRYADLFSPKGYPPREKLVYLRRHGGLLWPVQFAGIYARDLLRISLGR